jgi:tetratricopeptide (TPR) repeat protein
MAAALRTNLYWFCYRRRDAETLPDWLKTSPNVCVVVPDGPALAPSAEPDLSVAAGSARAKGKIVEVGEKETGTHSSSATERDEPVMQATTVFDELIRRFSLDAPPLTKDPLGFFAGHLRNSLLGDKPDEPENDVYAIRAVIDRLGKLRDRETALPPPSHAELTLESVRNLIRQSDLRQAIRLADDIPLQDLVAEQLLELISALEDAASALNDNSAEQLRSCDVILGAAARLEELRQPDLFTRSRVAKTLVNKGFTLGALNRSEEAAAVYDEVVRRFGDATEPALREQVAKALFRQGLSLGALNRREEEIGVYDEMVRRFGDATEPSVRGLVAEALVNKGSTLGALNRCAEAVGVSDEVERRFGDATGSSVRGAVVSALFNKAWSLGELHRREDAVGVYDELVRRFGSEPSVREYVAKAMFNKGLWLSDLDRNEEEIGVYDELVRRFGDATEPVLRELAAMALFNKGVRLGALKRGEDEIGVYDEVMRRYGDATEPALREHVAKALFNKGLALGTLKRSEDAIGVCNEVVRRFGDATEPSLRELVAKARTARNRLLPVPPAPPS